MRRGLIAALSLALLVMGATAVQADQGRSDVGPEVKQATVHYRDVNRALADGFAPFSLDPDNPEVPTCFESASGGMGVHYVRNIDDVVDATDPEALVYEVRSDGTLRLVGVEYIVPAVFVDPANPPELFGQDFHPHSFLPVYILHAWIWRTNPDGMFADYNPKVGPCPA